MEQTKTDENLAKVKNFFINNIGFILILIIFVVNTARTFISVGLTGKSIADILTDGAFSLIFGWVIKTTLQEQGLLKGLNSKDLLSTRKLHSETTIRIKQYRPMLQAFCDVKNSEERIRLRTQILCEKNLNYEDVFNEDSSVLDAIVEKRLKDVKERIKRTNFEATEKQIQKEVSRERREINRVVKRAWSVKITELTPSIMTTDVGKVKDPYDFGITIGQYTKKKASTKLAFSLVTMILFGALKPIMNDFDMANFIWSVMMMGTFIASGLWSFFSSYMFIIDQYRKGLIKKIDYLEEFEVGCQSGNTFAPPEEIIRKKQEIENGQQT